MNAQPTLTPRNLYGMHTLATPELKAQAARVREELHPEPDYATDPQAWDYWMRQIAHAACQKRGFVNSFARTDFLTEVTKIVTAKGHMGDSRWYLRIMSQQLKGRGYGRKIYTQKPTTFDNPFGARGSRRFESPFGKSLDKTPEQLAAETAAALATIAPKPVEDTVTDLVADKTTLKETFPRTADNQPAEKPAHETDPARVPFAVTNHIKRETGITAGIGTFIAKLFPGGLDAGRVRELSADSVWATVEAAVAEFNAKKSAPKVEMQETPENGTIVEIQDTPSTTSKVEEKTQEQPFSPQIDTVPSVQEKSQPSAIIPYQPKAVAHTLNVDWKITPLEMAQFAVQSGLYKGIDSPAKAMVVMMRGLELGVSPLTALEQINIIDGKTTVSSALFLALIERSGQLENMTIDDSKPDVCTVTLTRRGRTPITATFTLDDAKRMGLAGKRNWQNMPKTMLYHRALGVAGRRAFSDILLFGGGIYMPEELAPDTVVDENGEVIAA